jgi:glycerate 2-kinase
VSEVPGGGAAGGLAGGLVGLADRMEGADLAITGEGHLDPPSFHGKVPGGVLNLARARGRRGAALPVLCIAGGVDAALLAAPPAGLEVVSLTARFGQARARAETGALIDLVTAEALSRFCP